MTPFAPVIVSAATSALTIASSVASTVAAKSGSRRPLASTRASVASPGSEAALRLAVEKATKMSPELFVAMLPMRASPSETRRAIRSSWCGITGASVATTTMIEPSRPAPPAPSAPPPPGRDGMRSAISRPTGTPATRSKWRLP